MSDIEKIDNYEIMDEIPPDWRPKVFIIFGIGGTLVGLLAAYLFIQNVNEDDVNAPEFTAGKGLRIGLLLLGLLRNIADLAT